MRATLLFLLLILSGIPFRSAAQQENIWAFGNHAGLDFSTGNPVVLTTAIAGFGEANASVCDNNGHLLFYTEGTKVWDRNHTLMPNGNNLTPETVPSSMSALSSVTTSTGQGVVIVPMPDSVHKYYVFSLTASELGAGSGKLYYSIIDMRLHNGLGDVVAAQKGLYLDSGLCETMAGVIGDACNLWLITRSRNGLVFKARELTTAGIGTTPVISNTGELMGDDDRGFHLAFSPDRKRLATGKTLYDFNALTGAVTNPVRLFPNAVTNDSITYGVCFSPDNSKLYVNVQQSFWANSRTCQFDLSTATPAAIMASAVPVGYPFSATDLKMGPDHKIYFISIGGDIGSMPLTTLGRIEQPDLAGSACLYVNNAVSLNASCAAYFGLPAVVPVFRRDTVYHKQSLTAPCFTNNISLSAVAAGNDYTWNTGATGPQLTVSQSGVYYVSYKQSPCNFYRDSFFVYMRSPMPSTGFRESGCTGEHKGKTWVLPAAGDTTTYRYTWKNGAGAVLKDTSHRYADTLEQLPPGTYSVSMLGINGCDTFFTFVLPEPGRASFTTDSILCLTDTLHLVNTSTPGYFTAWQWNFGDGSSSTVFNPSHSYNAAGSYRIRLIATKDDCVDTAYKPVTADPVTASYFTMSSKDICIGEAITFEPAADSTAVSYTWNFGDNDDLEQVPGATTRHAFAYSGRLPVQLTTHFRACPDLLYMDTVAVHPFPLVDLGPDTAICLQGRPVLLFNHAMNAAGLYQYRWSTTETSEQISIGHEGTYSLSLSNDYGCTTTESITVNKDCYIDIPNVFSPNNDNVNDYFFPRQLLSRKVSSFHMQVLNRWGQPVFETRDTGGRGWDGRFNGKEQPEGVYIYLIEAVIDGRQPEPYQGNVTLVR